MPRSWIFGLLLVATLLVACESRTQAQGTRFRADWLFLTRDSDAPSSSLIVGSDPFSSDADFNYESGYRLFFSTGTEAYDVEFRFSQLDDWQDQRNRRLFDELSFDEEFTNPLVTNFPFVNILNFNNTLYTASEFDDGGGPNDETTEGELLEAFSTAVYEVDTNYRDFDVTLKTSRLNWWRFGVGYRHIDFDETNGLRIRGTFAALDAPTGGAPGDAGNIPNDILSHQALNAVGLRRTSGAADGFAHGDDLRLYYNSSNDNNLNGLQVTFDGNIYDGSYFLFETYANLGLYHNQITASLVERYVGAGSNDSVYQSSLRDRENDLAWASQIGVRGAVKLTDNWKISLGYEVLFIDGLALGPNQSRVTTFNTIPVGGDQSVFMHGGTVGFEGTW